MFVFYVLLSLTLNFQALNCVIYHKNESTLVPIGDYSDFKYLEINSLECGNRFFPTIPENVTLAVMLIEVMKSCLANRYNSESFETVGRIHNSIQGERPQPRVYKGTLASEGEAPWTVMLIKEGYSFICTGNLITFEWVLTAAHCGEDLSAEAELKIIAGSNKRRKGVIRFKDIWIRHPDYVNVSISDDPDTQTSIRNQNDIALIKLDKPFTRHKTEGRYVLNTICLPKKNPFIYAPGPANFFGFGTKDGPSRYFEDYAENPLKGDVNLLSLPECENMYCANYTEEGHSMPCQGDSGGPLVRYSEPFFTRGVQIGVLKGILPGPPEGDIRDCFPDIVKQAFWSSVPFHIDWILNTIKDN